MPARTWMRGSSLKHRKHPLRRRAPMRVGPSIKYGPVDRLFARYIRIRDKFCQYCKVNNGKRLEAAHIFGRGQHSVRYDVENVYAMHGGPNGVTCHRWLDQHDTEKKAWCRQRIGDARFDALQLRASHARKPDLVLIRLWLTQELKKLEAA